MVGFNYNGADYFLEKNLQGDVIALLDKDGYFVAEYVYDAWGKLLLIKDRNGNDISNNTSHIGYINPIRYRSYYYDVETNLYYLESRYYDPETGRFLNADSLSYLGEGSDLQNYNLYSYCENNPVMYCDPTGHAALAVALGVIAAVGLGLTIVGAATENNGLTAAGLTMVAASALISGGLAAFGTTGLFSTVVGGATMIAGAGTGLFASAEYQQAFTGRNWILDSGMSEGWYNGLMIGTAFFAMAGTIASSMAYSLKIERILEVGKIKGVRATKGFSGFRFTDTAGKIRSLEYHWPHDGQGIHLQLNDWWLNKSGYVGQYYRAFAKHFQIFKPWKGWY